ncbi:MFS transporter [Pseudomonas sp. NY15181]|uniref:MFS transporter n=1 Tax=Pseudomonas sp. NY15181 TaxID=3400349 RepID=UPI003A856261
MIYVKRDWRVLTSVCLAILAMPLCFSAGILAVPAIRADIGGGALELAWITNGYILLVSCTMLAAGTLADHIGRKRVFTFGVIGFSSISLLLGLAPNVTYLAMLRTLQGTAGAALLAGGTAVLANYFHGAAQRKALSWIGVSFGVGLALGPPVSGLLIDILGWRSIFFVSFVLGVVAFLIGSGQLQESKDPDAESIDWLGILTIGASLSLLTWCFLQAPETGWTSLQTFMCFFAAVFFLAVFIGLQLKRTRPMLDVSLFKYSRFLAVQSLPIATTFCYVVLLLVLPIRLVSVEGMSPLPAGAAMFSLSLPLMVVPRCTPWLSRFISPGLLSAIGLLVASIGLIMLSDRGLDGSILELIGSLLVIGIGTGLPWGLMDGLSVTVVPAERSGMAAGIFNTIRLASESIGLALATAMLALLISNHLPGQDVSSAAFRMVLGDLDDTAKIFEGVSRAELLGIYAESFSTLLRFLALITLGFAGFVVVFFAHGSSEESCGVS